MIKTKGIATRAPQDQLAPFSFERRNPKDHDVVIDIKYCGICHSDIHQARNEWGHSTYPMVPGHEIAGVVRQVGTKVSKYKVGDHVGVGCFVDSCRTCSSCKQDLDNYCLEGHTMTYNSPERDGSSITMGGYSDVIVVDENYVLKIPNSIPLDKAAPLLCAGITLYSPLMHWKAGPHKKVGILGMGGLGHMGVKIGVALGAEITVLSHSDKKKDDAMKMGAHNFVATKDPENLKKYAGYFDLIINTVSSADINMMDYFNLLKLDATLVALGAPEKPLSISPFPLILMRRNYAGSVIGGIKETQEMLDFCAKHNIVPEIEVINSSQVNQAYERILKSDVRYRFVIDMATLS
jgi:uncharacterized zinc-type alcohol dehydrogenase-like protein